MAVNIDWQLKCGQIRQRGEQLLATEQWMDCNFLLGPDKVPMKAHKLILAMASPVFEAMFYGPIAEKKFPITIPDIEPVIFCQLLQYVYTDDIHLEDYLMAIELYYAAQKYMLAHLMTLCTKYLSCNLVPQKACRVYEFAEEIGDEKLKQQSMRMITSYTELALSDSSFEELSLNTIVEIFSMNALNINSELILLEAAERYVLASEKNELEDEHEAFYSTLGEKMIAGLNNQATNSIRSTTNSHISMENSSYLDEVDEIISNGNSNFTLNENNNEIIVKENENAKNDVEIQSCSKGQDMGNEAGDIVKDNQGIRKISKPVKSMRKLLEPIRFLTLTVEELAEYKLKTTLLTEHDMLAIMMNIASFATYMPMPEGFSVYRKKRLFPPPQTIRCLSY